MESSLSNLVISMPKGQGYKITKWKFKDGTDEKLPIWTAGSELLLSFTLERISDSYSSHAFNSLFHFKNAFLLQCTLFRKWNNTLAIIQVLVGNFTRKQHPQIHSEWDTVSCLPKSVSYQLYWRRRDHYPNTCQVVLKTALMGSINRASFSFILR